MNSCSGQIDLFDFGKRDFRLAVLRQQSVDFLLHIGKLGVAVAANIVHAFDRPGQTLEPFEEFRFRATWRP